ncbi:PQQ-like beta-propeller repeat protein [bacterium]|nr:PQQ-like beta-propeller repeat protein [bacterium]
MSEQESDVSRREPGNPPHQEGASSSGSSHHEPGSVGDIASNSKYFNLRIWPAILLLAVMVVAKLLPSMVENGPSQIWMSAAFGPLLGALLVLLWWLIASRARWQERLLGLIGLAVTFALAAVLLDSSMLGPAVLVLTIPMGVGAFAIGAIAFSRLKSPARTGVALLLALLGFGYTDLLRAEGMWGNFAFDLHWRWAPDAEDRLLASQGESSSEASAGYSPEQVQDWLANSEWSGFRGEGRDSRQQGVVFTSDWKSRPPQEEWRVPVGPGWSSFAVAGKMLYTQEQVADRELISCYDAETGRNIWTQGIESRFDDPLGGPGPRATPTLAEGGVFSLGAQLTLHLNSIKDDDLRWLIGCKTNSIGLSITNSKELTDKGIRSLENTNITSLTLYKTGITAKAMKSIGSLSQLLTLTIKDSPIDDDSLMRLSELKVLRQLSLTGTKVTSEGMAAIKGKLTTLRYTIPAAPSPQSKEKEPEAPKKIAPKPPANG